jgi:elongation factor G
MAVEVDTPGEAQGDLIGDLNRRRRDIVSVDPGRTNVLLKARVPLSELWGYANAIRSLSRGRAGYSMTPSHFERVPEALTTKVISERK